MGPPDTARQRGPGAAGYRARRVAYLCSAAGVVVGAVRDMTKAAHVGRPRSCVVGACGGLWVAGGHDDDVGVAVLGFGLVVVGFGWAACGVGDVVSSVGQSG